MSCDRHRGVHHSASWLKAASIAMVAMLGLVISGIRPETVEAQSPPATEATATDVAETPDEAQADDTATEAADPLAAYIPANALFVVTARPREILNDPAIKPHAEDIEELWAQSAPGRWDVLREAGLVPDNIESLAIGQLRDRNKLVIAVRTAKPLDRAVIGKAAGKSTIVLGGVVYPLSGMVQLALPDERTILIAEESETIAEMLVDGQIHRKESPWTNLARRMGNPPFAILIKGSMVWNEIQSEFHDEIQHGRAPTFIEPVLSILKRARLAGLAVRLGEKPSLTASIEGEAENSAPWIAGTLEELATLCQSTLHQYKNRIGEPTESEREMAEFLVPLAENFLEDVTIQQKGNDVHLAWDLGGTETLLSVAMKALRQARRVADVTRSKNNLKQIALAFHNYHDIYGFFPPAVIEEKGVQRSWRVEILPFLGAGDLYNEYRRDEPWDSEHNQKLLARMPEALRDPLDESKPNSASYYLLTNDHAVTNARSKALADFIEEVDDDDRVPDLPVAEFVALFTDRPIDIHTDGQGPQIRNITDGTSNTFMAVEASRDVPWTKPEDISVDPKKLEGLLKNDLGGIHEDIFRAAFCDGSVRTIAKTVDLEVLKKLIMPADGQPLDIPNSSQVPIGESE